MMRAADHLARRLAEAGCRHAFGIPGGEVLAIIDALEAAGITFHLAKHETAAGFMAEACWHRTGAPGILVATVGPGLSNAINVIANARLDRVPLIVIAGAVDADDRLSYTHQVIDHARLVEPAVKGSFELNAVRPDLVAERALALAGDPRPGPVLIDVPIRVAAMSVEGAGRKLRRPPVGASGPAEGDALARARSWLAQSRRPLMIAGFDAVIDDAGPAIRDFVERFRVPVIQTYKAKGILDEDHPMALAPAALSPVADARLKPVIECADLIILAGYDAVEMRPSWQNPWDETTKRVVEFSATANDHYMHQAGLFFVCDTGAGLRALAGGGAEPSGQWSDEEIAGLRSAVLEPFRIDEEWGPAAITDVARKVLPPETIATVDAGAHRILFNQVWRCPQPRTLLQSNGLCTMGGAMPLAIGARIAEPGRPAVAFFGDGGLLMFTGELATCSELGLPVIFVVFVDRSLALIEKKQRESQLRKLGVDLGRFDYEAIARGFGGHGVTVRDRPGLEAALRQALNADRFTLIACEIDENAYDGRI
ncbi:MAG: thiamine pyrophosphate-binding protein [Geminicoccaceae bacterium]|nr:thiamine pyrophosphate-binding protein [Geminicoccaceae bacterium]